MQQRSSFPWMAAGASGLFLGIAGGVFSSLGKSWFEYTIPAAMMIASFITVNRVKEMRFWAGFTASTLAALIGWSIYMILDLSVGVGQSMGQVLLQSAAFLGPMILLIGVAGTWFFARSRVKMDEVQQKMEREKEVKKKQEERQSKFPKRRRLKVKR